MFATPSMAARIDAAEGSTLSGFTPLALARDASCEARTFPVGDGVAVFAGSRSVVNKIIGVGFGSLPQTAQLDAVERHFTKHASAIQAEVSSLADPAAHTFFAKRGYEPRGFENVLGHQLTSIRDAVADHITVTPVTGAQRAAWVTVLSHGFANPDVGGPEPAVQLSTPEVQRWFEDVMTRADFQAYGAFIDATLVAGGLVRYHAGLAQFSGASTIPAYRRQGAQTSLVRVRLRHAAQRGCDLAVVVTQPGSKSESNAVREGFELLYTRQLWVKEP